MFRNVEKLKQAVLTYIATQLSSREIREYKKLFAELDTNNDGIISVDEMKCALSKHKSKEEIDNMISAMGIAEKGEINYLEFLSANMNADVFLKKEYLIETFNSLDTKKTGKISSNEIKSLFEKDASIDTAVCDEMIKSVDINGDGEIDFEEFMAMMYDLKKQYSFMSKNSSATYSTPKQ